MEILEFHQNIPPQLSCSPLHSDRRCKSLYVAASVRALIWLALFTASRWRVERQWRAMAMSNRPNSLVSYKTEHHRYLVTLSPLLTSGCVCKSGAHKAEQPHLWRVIKPQSGERGGEAAAKQESLRLRSSAPCHKPSIPALRGAHHLDHGRGKQRFRCDECAPRTLTEPHSKEPHSMLIRAFARARNRETGARNCDTLHNEI